ncbi:hypothetical protein [Serratia ficaria]|uniref:hypothetical protein n=1 Tax=Serratia ficaria TaxID=61651 RepID=UPI002182878A|nr:hypothetical protein [Serratia ficaria]CAI2536097.1 Uncharacterised protein [Serratia ficaria]
MSKSPFSVLSGAFRARVVKTWSMSIDSTQAEAAVILTEEALKQGYIRRDKPVKGTTLAEWSKEQSTPLWAALAAISLLLQQQWTPKTHEEWAGFASLYIKMNKSTELDTLLDGLPVQIDPVIVAGWLCAAVEDDLCYRAIKRLTK